MKMTAECPECGRAAVVYDKQSQFVCVDKSGCAFMCEMSSLTGTLHCTDDEWELYDTAEQ